MALPDDPADKTTTDVDDIVFDLDYARKDLRGMTEML
jgi:hypothetical protein